MKKNAKTLLSNIHSVNFHNNGKIDVPLEVELIKRKLITRYIYLKRSLNDEMTKIESSIFFKHLLSFYEKKINKNIIGVREDDDLKLVTYQGHDYNLISLVKNLLDPESLESLIKSAEDVDIFDFLIPSYASLFEFHLIRDANTNQHFVKILYDGEEIFAAPELGRKRFTGINFLLRKVSGRALTYLPGKGISFEDFKSLLQSRISNDYKNCSKTIKKYKQY